MSRQPKTVIVGPSSAVHVVPLLLSARSARSRWQGCSPDYIQTTCRGRCCRVQGQDRLFRTVVPLEQDQARALLSDPCLSSLSGTVTPAQEKRGSYPCPQQGPSGLCGLHHKTLGIAHLPQPLPLKPRSCTVSPWQVLPSGTVVIRNRYRLLGCYDHPNAVPAYHAFADGLRLLFGQSATVQIQHLLANDPTLERVCAYARLPFVSFLQSVSQQRKQTAQKRPSRSPEPSP